MGDPARCGSSHTHCQRRLLDRERDLLTEQAASLHSACAEMKTSLHETVRELASKQVAKYSAAVGHSLDYSLDFVRPTVEEQ